MASHIQDIFNKMKQLHHRETENKKTADHDPWKDFPVTDVPKRVPNAGAKSTVPFKKAKSPHIIEDSGKISAAITISRPFLFRLEKSGKTFFLFGTDHFLNLQDFSMDVQKTVCSAKTFIAENPVEEGTDFKRFLEFAHCDKSAVFDKLDEKTQNLLLKKLGEEAKTLQAWALFFLYDAPIPTLSDAAAVDNILSLEDSIRRKVKSNGGRILSLDTFTSTVLSTGIQDIPFEEIFGKDKLFERSLTTESLTKELEELLEKSETAYQNGDIDTYEKISKEFMHRIIPSKGLEYVGMERSVRARNLIWLNKLKKYFADPNNLDPCVVGVGARHLILEFGLLALLRQEGWSITRYPFTTPAEERKIPSEERKVSEDKKASEDRKTVSDHPKPRKFVAPVLLHKNNASPTPSTRPASDSRSSGVRNLVNMYQQITTPVGSTSTAKLSAPTLTVSVRDRVNLINNQ